MEVTLTLPLYIHKDVHSIENINSIELSLNKSKKTIGCCFGCLGIDSSISLKNVSHIINKININNATVNITLLNNFIHLKDLKLNAIVNSISENGDFLFIAINIDYKVPENFILCGNNRKNKIINLLDIKF